MNRCDKNPKRFFWHHYFGPHEFVHLREGRVTYGTGRLGLYPFVEEDYRTCQKCGLQEKAEYTIIDFGYDWKPRFTGKWIPFNAEDGLSIWQEQKKQKINP